MTLSAPEITPESARQLTDRIKVAVEGCWHLITEAYASRAWAALGYHSWDDYCTREFGTSRLRLPREERSEVVASLRESGLSIRAIAAATGISDQTVQRDLRPVVNHYTSLEDEPDEETPPSTTPQGEPVSRGVDGGPTEPVLTQAECEALDDVGYCDCDDGLCECVMGECSCGQVPGLPESDRPEWEVKGEAAIEYFDRPPPEAVPEKRVTGTDGKSYPAPKPARETPNRRPITDAFRSAAYDLGKRVTTLTNLAADDRFKRNADQLADRNLAELTRARDALQRVIDKLTQQGV